MAKRVARADLARIISMRTVNSQEEEEKEEAAAAEEKQKQRWVFS